MSALRFLTAATILWLLLLYGIGESTTLVVYTPALYITSIVFVLLSLLLQPFSRLSYFWLLPMAALLYFLLNFILEGFNGPKFDVDVLPVIFTEGCAIGVSVVLARSLGRQLNRFGTAFEELLIGPIGKATNSFDTGQGQIYAELRRARRHASPAALMVVSPGMPSRELLGKYLNPNGEGHRLIADLERDILGKYVSARVAAFLSQKLEDDAIVAQRGDGFVVFLPETDCDAMAGIVSGLESAAKEELNLRLHIGASTFPEEAVTFESLLERAEAAVPVGHAYHPQWQRLVKIRSQQSWIGPLAADQPAPRESVSPPP